MRCKLATLVFVATCLPAMAAVPPGNRGVVTGRVQIERGAEGTYLNMGSAHSPRAVVGFIPFGNEGSFPGLDQLEGRRVTMSGVVILDGRPTIVLTDPEQLKPVG